MPLCNIYRNVSASSSSKNDEGESGLVIVENLATKQCHYWNQEVNKFVAQHDHQVLAKENLKLVYEKKYLYGVTTIDSSSDVSILIIVDESEEYQQQHQGSLSTSPDIVRSLFCANDEDRASSSSGCYSIRRVTKFAFLPLTRPSSSSSSNMIWNKLIQPETLPEIQRLVSDEKANYYFIASSSSSSSSNVLFDVQMNLTRPVSHVFSNNNKEKGRRSDKMFCFNREQFMEQENDDDHSSSLFTPMIRGYIGHFEVALQQDHDEYKNNTSTTPPPAIVVVVLLIARQCPGRVGPRYHARGLHHHHHHHGSSTDDNEDQNGEDVSNFYEVEQIVLSSSSSSSSSLINNTQNDDYIVSSFLTYRGSIPFTWSQSPTLFNIKPPVVFQEKSKSRFDRHFDTLHQRSRVTEKIRVLSLLSTRHHELELTNTYQQHASSSSSVVVAPVEYCHFNSNFLKWKSLTEDTLKYSSSPLLPATATATATASSSSTPASSSVFDASNLTVVASSSSNHYPHQQQQQQHTAFRINCLDCLDRTSLCQVEISLEMLLKHQLNLVIIGTTSTTTTNTTTNLMKMKMKMNIESQFRNMFQDCADVIAWTYAGSNALFGRVVRTKRNCYCYDDNDDGIDQHQNTDNTKTKNKKKKHQKNPGGIMMRIGDAFNGLRRFRYALWWNSRKQEAETFMTKRRVKINSVIDDNKQQQQHNDEDVDIIHRHQIVDSTLTHRRLLPYVHSLIMLGYVASALTIGLWVPVGLVKNCLLPLLLSSSTSSSSSLLSPPLQYYGVLAAVSLGYIVVARVASKRVGLLQPSKVLIF